MDNLKMLLGTGPASVRDVYRRRAKDEDLAYNAVQTLMRIMEDKGLLKHHVEGRAFIYTPIHTREESVHGFLDQVFDGAADQLVMALLRSEKLSGKELDKLQAMIETA